MKIICSKDILLNGINTVSKAVSNKTTLPILECILLKANDTNFEIMANDLELGIKSRLQNVNIIETGSVALESRILLEIVRRMPEDDIEISSDGNNLTVIKCANSEYKILGQNGNEFPDLPVIEKDIEYTIQQSELKDMISQTIFSVSTDELRITLTGELIEIKDNFINLVSLDGYRISFRKLEIPDIKKDVSAIIPKKTLTEMSKILSSEDEFEVSIYFTDKHILFDLGDSIVVSRTIEGDFLKYEQIFSNDYNTIIAIDRKNLIMSLERASLLSKDGKKNPVKLEIKVGKLIITSNSELGTAYEEIEADTKGDELNIAFNPKYLLEALKAINDEVINIIFTSTLSPCVIRPLEGDSYKYLILPVRLNN